MTPRSLASRFVIIMVAGALALAMAAAALSYHLARKRTEAEVSTTLEGVTTAIEKTVAAGVYAIDPLLLDELTQGTIRHTQIDAVRVTDADGKTLAIATDSGEDNASGAFWQTGLITQSRLYSPFDENEFIGTLQLHADAAYLSSSMRRQAMLLGLILIGLIAVLAGLINALTLRLVVNPMSQLARQLASMKPGVAQRIEVSGPHSDDEIGTVVNAANRLLEANHAALERERTMRETVAAMEARYRQIFDHTSAGIFLLNARFQLVNSNRAISDLLQTTAEALDHMGQGNFLELMFIDPRGVQEMIEETRRSGQTSAADLEIRTTGGDHRWVHCLISAQAGRQEGELLVEGVVYDVTERRAAESEIAYMAEHDALTGLKSRAFFHKVLRHYVERARTIHTPVTLIYIDLDLFKQVNDTHGHEAGDRVLIECGRRLNDLLHRNSDMAARLGGDEFTIILDGVGAEEQAAMTLARQIVRVMKEPIEVAPGVHVRVGASVGLASFPLHAADSEELVRAADRAMYEIKRLGKGSWQVSGGAPALAG